MNTAMTDEEILFAFTNAIQPARRALLQVVTRAVEQTGLSPSLAMAVLLSSRRGRDASQKDIAQELGVHPAALVRTLDQAEELGLLSRVSSPTDRRSKEIVLTEEGERIAGRMERDLNEMRVKVLGDLPMGDLKIATRMLRILEERSAAFLEEVREVR